MEVVPHRREVRAWMAVANDETWASWEYLGLYPRIAWGEMEGQSGSVWMVWNHTANTAQTLKDWLAGA